MKVMYTKLSPNNSKTERQCSVAHLELIHLIWTLSEKLSDIKMQLFLTHLIYPLRQSDRLEGNGQTKSEVDLARAAVRE